jgi:hypothetical protein
MDQKNMAHFAELDNNNIVISVVVVHNNELLDENGVESEQKGINFLKTIFDSNKKWIQTSYNGNFRRKYAQIDGRYDPILNIFVDKQPYKSWELNTTTYEWEPPIPFPNDGFPYDWNEDVKNWDRVIL